MDDRGCHAEPQSGAPVQLWTFAAGLGTAAALVAVVAFGKGAKFIFDIGLGSAERIAAMKIPYC